jgi:hypothetical protein
MRSSTDKNLATLMIIKYLNASTTFAIVAFPSNNTNCTHSMLDISEENAAVFDASLFEKEIPISAYFIAALIIDKSLRSH